MKQWRGRSVNQPTSSRAFGPEDDARLRPLAVERVARMKGRTVCFVCDGEVLTQDASGLYTGVDPPIIVALEPGLMMRPLACVKHTIPEEWPAADLELIHWMVRNGWGKPMDPTILGDVQ